MAAAGFSAEERQKLAGRLARALAKASTTADASAIALDVACSFAVEVASERFERELVGLRARIAEEVARATDRYMLPSLDELSSRVETLERQLRLRAAA